VPFLFAKGPGSEIQRPLAIVVIGGLVSSTALTLLLLPMLYAAFEGKGEVHDRHMHLTTHKDREELDAEHGTADLPAGAAVGE
jgi:hypothetical protein